MPTLFFLLRLLTTVTPLGAEAGLWSARVADCLATSAATLWMAEPDLLAFACGEGSRRLVVMANSADLPRDVVRETAEPLVPVFASNGDPGGVASLLITFFESGAVQYSNRIPPQTVVVFRPAAERDVRPGGVEE